MVERTVTTPEEELLQRFQAELNALDPVAIVLTAPDAWKLLNELYRLCTPAAEDRSEIVDILAAMLGALLAPAGSAARELLDLDGQPGVTGGN
jgi:hypothetical protein